MNRALTIRICYYHANLTDFEIVTTIWPQQRSYNLKMNTLNFTQKSSPTERTQ